MLKDINSNIRTEGVKVGKRKRPTQADLAIHRLRAEKDVRELGYVPTDPLFRSICVLRYIDRVDGVRHDPVPKQLQGKVRPDTGRHGAKDHRHPAHKTRAEKRAAFWHPDEGEKELQRINALMRNKMRDHAEQGMIAGPIAVAVSYAIEKWAEEAYGLPGPEHAAALRVYLEDVVGMVFHRFDPNLPPNAWFAGIPSYDTWREACLNQA